MINKGFITKKDAHKIAYKHYAQGHGEVVVIVHGFYNSKDSALLCKLAEHLSKERDVFMFDLSGHGESSGLFTWTSNESGDLDTVLTYLNDKYNAAHVIGFSMGGSVSVNVLSKKRYNVKSLICVSAPSDCSKVDFKWWKLDVENDLWYSLITKEGTKGKGVRPGPFWLGKEKPVNNMAKLSMPVLFIHGDKDWVVDKWHSEAMHEQAKTDKDMVIIKNGPHAEYLMRKHSKLLLDSIDGWLSERRSR